MTTTEAPTETPVPEPTIEPTQEVQSPPVDNAYVETVRGEVAMLQGSLDAFLVDYLALLEGTDPDEDALLDRLVETLDMWSGYPATAAGIVAPTEYEDIDAEYQQLAQDFEAASTQFRTAISLIASDDSVGGEAAFQEFLAQVDGIYTRIETINGLLDQHDQGGTTTTETPIPEPTAEPTMEPTIEPTAEVVDISETGSRGGRQDRSSTTTQTASDVEDLGLVAEGEYLSPQFDLEILWDDTWEFDPSIVDEPIASDEEEGVDWIILAWTGGGPGDITITLGDQRGFDPMAMTEYWESAEYTDQFDIPADVLLVESSDDRGAVLLLIDGGTEQQVIYKEAICLDRRCSEYALVTILASVDDAADVIADAEDGITIDGAPATEVFTFREIRSALND